MWIESFPEDFCSRILRVRLEDFVCRFARPQPHLSGLAEYLQNRIDKLPSLDASYQSLNDQSNISVEPSVMFHLPRSGKSHRINLDIQCPPPIRV